MSSNTITYLSVGMVWIGAVFCAYYHTFLMPAFTAVGVWMLWTLWKDAK